jgi:glycine oxidase
MSNLIAKRRVDYVIVGQGLAGSCLAIQLCTRNKSVMVFDQPHLNHSTAVAAGLFNPITGKMLAKTWQADVLFPYFYSFYRHAESLLNKKFFFPIPIYRPFSSVEEQNEWMGRSTHIAMKEYIEDIFLKSTFGDDVHDPVGGVVVRRGGYVDTRAFVSGVRLMLQSSGSYREESFDEGKLELNSAGVTYNDLEAKKIIFCRGVDDLYGRYFSWLPIKPLKGETLSIKMPTLDRIYNRGVYLVPGNGVGEFTVGATYSFDLTPSITLAGKAELENKLNELIKKPYSVTHQHWGIRPTTPDRRILMGPHPVYPNIVIFNGLGTKGVVLAPFFSDQMAAWLAGDGEIGPDVNIRRYKSLYFEA